MSYTPELCAAMRSILLNEHGHEAESALQLIDALPNDAALSFKPHERSMAYGELVAHLFGTGLYIASVVDGKQSGGPGPGSAPPTTKAALRAACEAMNKEYLERLAAIPPARLAEGINFFGLGDWPGIEHFKANLKHLIHHRGQLTVYLRVMGAKVPAVYGPTADVSMQEIVAEMAGK